MEKEGQEMQLTGFDTPTAFNPQAQRPLTASGLLPPMKSMDKTGPDWKITLTPQGNLEKLDSQAKLG